DGASRASHLDVARAPRDLHSFPTRRSSDLNSSACVASERSRRSQSISWRRSSRLNVKALFFKPIQLGAEPSNFGVELVDAFIVTGLLFFPTGFSGENLRQLFQRLLAPPVKLRRMDPILRRQLRYATRFFEQFQNNLCLETW